MSKKYFLFRNDDKFEFLDDTKCYFINNTIFGWRDGEGKIFTQNNYIYIQPGSYERIECIGETKYSYQQTIEDLLIIHYVADVLIG